jgi:PAS domain S-box-containing protein
MKALPPAPDRPRKRTAADQRIIVTLGLDPASTSKLSHAIGKELPAGLVRAYEGADDLANAPIAGPAPDLFIVAAAPDHAALSAQATKLKQSHPRSLVLALAPSRASVRELIAIDRVADARLGIDATVDELTEAVEALLDAPPAASNTSDARAMETMLPMSICAGCGDSLLIEQLPAAVYVLQADKFAFVNQAATELLGRSAADLRQLNYWEVVDPSRQPELRDRLRGWLEGRPIEFHGITPIVTGRGERRWIEVFRRRIEFRGAPALLMASLDLTERWPWMESAKRLIERFDGPRDVESGAPFPKAHWLIGPRTQEPRGEAPGEAIGSLTRRQRQVLDLIAQGRSNKQIARDLGITEGTAKLHVFSLMRLFQVANRTMLALVAHALRPATGD